MTLRAEVRSTSGTLVSTSPLQVTAPFPYHYADTLSLQGVPPGNYRLVFILKGARIGQRSVDVATASLSVRAISRQIMGTVQLDREDPFGVCETPAAQDLLALYRDDGDGVFDRETDPLVAETHASDQGHYSFDDPEVGSYWVLSSSDPCSPGPLVPVGADQIVQHDICECAK